MLDAGIEGSRTERENAGDPTAYQAERPKLGISTYDADKGESRDIPLPFKDMERLVQTAYDALPNFKGIGGGGHLQQAQEEGLGLITSRAKPLIGLGVNELSTLVDERANEAGSYRGYNVMFDKDLPDQAYSDFAKQVVSTALPVPFPFVTHEIIQNGFDPKQMYSYIEEAAGLGYVTEREADSYKKAMGKPQLFLQRESTKLHRIMSGPEPMTEQQQTAYKARVSQTYADMVKKLKAQIDASKEKKGGPPAWLTSPHAPAPAWLNAQTPGQ
jgi:hypothetical protein